MSLLTEHKEVKKIYKEKKRVACLSFKLKKKKMTSKSQYKKK